MVRKLLLSSLLGLSLSVSALVACQGCPRPGAERVDGSGALPSDPSTEEPSLRIYFVSNVAGALEPCGCVKSQLGGLGHAAALIEQERAKAPRSLLLAAGPTFFLDRETKPERVAQEKEKAVTLAKGLNRLGLVAVAEGENDVALGKGVASELAASGKAEFLGKSVGGIQTSRVYPFGDIKLAVLGVSTDAGAPLDRSKVRDAVANVKKQGANMVVLLASVGRGEAKRIADDVPDLAAIVVGESSMGGEANTGVPSAERLGNVIVAETSNHLQTIGVLDFFVRKGGAGQDGLVFAEATSLKQGKAKSALFDKIQKLRGDKANLEQSRKTVEAVKTQADIDAAERELKALEFAPAPKQGSYFRYSIRSVRSEIGDEPGMTEMLRAYYKSVNDANRTAFASRKPLPLGKDDVAYVGVEGCSTCHEDARKFWNGTSHANAYKTLSDQFKEFNLDCVSCHVTGYDRPGGSTVTAVDKLKDVQCEVCHGPGAKHAGNPKVAIPIARPTPQSCEGCHHPPHVHSFDAAAKMELILGPGHGRKK
jgi:Cytochrome c554 and c-prime